ncbi:MAG: hypothetical protein GY863_11385 [bacterium]|nr:hypothetical protein [bacterium]
MKKLIKTILCFCILFAGCTVSIDPEDEKDSWLVENTEHFNFFYGNYEVFLMPHWVNLNIDDIAERQEQGYAEVIADLDVTYEGVINFYIYHPVYVDNRPVQTGYADPTFETVYLRFHGAIFGKHEISHVISEQTIGRASIRLLNEGLAEALEYHEPADLVDVIDTFTWTIENYRVADENYIQMLLMRGDEIPTSVFYPQAGWFVQYLIDIYGIEKVKQLYTVDLSDFESMIMTLFSKSIEELEVGFFARYGYDPEYNRQ